MLKISLTQLWHPDALGRNYLRGVNHLLAKNPVCLVSPESRCRDYDPKIGFFLIVRLFACFLVCLLIAACAPGRGLPDLPSAAPSAYRLGPGDVVRLITFGEDALTGEFHVSDSGKLPFPLIGSVQASGLSPDELATHIQDALTQANMLRTPSVSAEVITYRPIFVLGEVNKPGQYPYQPGMTVVTAAAVAGGFTYRAIDAYASVVRTQDGAAIEAKATRNTYLMPGDTVTIYERKF